MEIDLIADARDYEKYFYMVAEGPRSTNSKTDISEIAGAFERQAVPVKSNKPLDTTEFEKSYPKWSLILQKFSLLFYGLGSKIELLRHFSKNYLGKFGYVVEADMFSGQSKLFNSTITALCDVSFAENNTLTSLIQNLKSRNQKAFIVLHSIDHEALNEHDFQNNLIQCAESGVIHIIASIDRTPLLPLRFLSGMKFFPIKVETDRYYTQEIGFSNNTKSGSSLDSIDRFVSVLKTLTDTANGIYRVLLKHQISTGDGLNKNEWTDMAATKLCVKMKGTFTTNVTEFLDHKLITEKKGGDFYTIPLQPLQLKTLLSKLDGE
ncbi:hypothetical protein TRFO_03843 [Tritrichomonas foetus]|uniref:Origin recognition complex subunit 2 n=1 Tax=Tritrichomonas foetus TaxID=1144522 RepID=A0A1J4KK10_9EUKA|nr:hypothetical protein TRFO_03843 [Tritrichomonas foetus]|eukprot:OHT11641.1 hypothetical protein TRFO_03843 [Tritrichomonas foetus]